jgi:photosystem II stability/assembly factor-like uncharacterized protein
MLETAVLQDIVYALAASPDFDRDGVCFAARAAGLYRSDDGGATWRSAYDSLNLPEPLLTMAVAVSPDFSTDQTVLAGVPGGILRSEDGGQSWQVVEFPAPPPVVSSLAISPNYAEDGLLLAGTLDDGVFLSTNRGRHWAVWNFGLFDPHILCLALSPHFNSDRTVFAGAETGLFRSHNGGRSWQDLALPVDDAVLSLALSPDYANDSTLLIGAETQGLFCSRDAGETWQRLGERLAAEAINGIIVAAAFPAPPELLVLLNDAILISPDGGATWTAAQQGLDLTQGTTSFVAPQGLAAHAPLLVGLVAGGVGRAKLAGQGSRVTE